MNPPQAASESTTPGDDVTRALADSVADFIRRQPHLARLRQVRGKAPGYERRVWRELANLGWTGILVPEEHGGLGLGTVEAITVARGLAAGVLAEPYSAAAILAATALVEGDQPALQAQLLPRLCSGELLPCLAWQEVPEAAVPESMEAVSVTARGNAGGNAVLNGVKQHLAGGIGADGYVVSATSAAGIALYWVPADATGVHVEQVPLCDGSFGATLTLRDAQAQCLASPAAALRALDLALQRSRLAAAAELVALSEAALEATLAYLRLRKQFDRIIGSFQALQHRAVDCYVQLRLAQGVLEESLDKAATAGVDAATAHRVKARCVHAAQLIMREAIQMHGAIGFTDACDISLYVKRSLVLSVWLGSEALHRREFARLAPPAPSRTPVRGTRVDQRLEDHPRDTDWDALPDESFRLVFREFIERNYPEDKRYLPRRVHWEEVRDWNRLLASHGWLAPSWPKAWGGMELSPAKQIIYIDELERWGVGRAPDQGVRQLGPAIMRYGTPEQQQFYLPKVLACEHIWAQGYSEPNAGSDLASVSTRAVQEGDEFVINGRKIWTSMAMDCTHIYVLCRTDTTVKKQAGISFIVVDLKTPGVTVRPIVDIAGNEEFCEITFDNVRTPATNLVGGLNRGWSVAKAVLDFERLGISSPWRPQIAFSRLTRLAEGRGLFADAAFLDRYTTLRLDLLDQATLYSQFAELARRGQNLGADVSVLKIWGMEAFQRVTELALEVAGPAGTQAHGFSLGSEKIDLLTPYYMARLITIGGGSNEIQRNIVAKAVLQLPT